MIVSNSSESWDIQFRIDRTELLDKESLLHHLRGIKHDLAKQFDLSESRMEFDGILRRDETDDFVDVVVRIKQIDIEKRDPVIHFREGITEDGTRYPKMRALLDLYYLDSHENPLRLSRIHEAINEAKLDLKLVHQDVIISTLKRVVDQRTAIKDVEIALGRFADIGKDAEIEFCFEVSTNLSDAELYFSSRKVRKGDVLCRLTPAVPGARKGVNVIGESIESEKGLDIELEPDSGVTLSIDRTEAIADEEGIAVVTREMREIKTPFGTKIFPHKVVLKVNPVLKVEGDQVLDIETSKSVEIVGSLKMGSRILTNCGVYVSGDVESGTLLAGQDIVIHGNVNDSTIRSDTSLIVQGIISNADLKAKHELVIDGEVQNSKLSGDTVTVGIVRNTSIIAEKCVTVDSTIDDDEHESTRIHVGMSEFYEQRIRENEKFLQMAREKLERIEQAIGKDMMDQINSANIQNRLLKILARNKTGKKLESKRQAAAFRKLLESIPAMLEMISWKEEENAALRKRLKTNDDSETNKVIIKERIGSKTMITVNGIEAEVSPWDGPVQFHIDEDNFLVMDQECDGDT